MTKAVYTVMRRMLPMLIVGTLLASAGCVGTTTLSESIPLRAATAETGDFEDLAVVLAKTVNEDGRIDPTALAVHLPRLEQQLARLAEPWPAEAGEIDGQVRLAWLYNTRASWSLWLVSRELQPAGLRRDRFVLPATLHSARLSAQRFPLDGAASTLATIDRELAEYDDFRIAVAAPGATDWDGPLPVKPFKPETMAERVALQFSAYANDDSRIVIDHDGRRLCAPPALAAKADDVTDAFNRRFQTRQSALATALRPWLDIRGRRRMGEALGYRTVRRTGKASVMAAEFIEARRLLVMD